MASDLVRGSDGREHDWIGEKEEELFTALVHVQSAEEARDFLIDLFSVHEIQNVAKRWCIVRQLLNGAPQSEARESCNTSKATVTRANRSIVRFGTGISRKLHERLQKR